MGLVVTPSTIPQAIRLADLVDQRRVDEQFHDGLSFLSLAFLTCAEAAVSRATASPFACRHPMRNERAVGHLPFDGLAGGPHVPAGQPLGLVRPVGGDRLDDFQMLVANLPDVAVGADEHPQHAVALGQLRQELGCPRPGPCGSGTGGPGRSSPPGRPRSPSR